MRNHWFELKTAYLGTEKKAFLFRDSTHDSITSFELGDIANLKYAIDSLIINHPDVFDSYGGLKPKPTKVTFVVEYDAAGVKPTVILPPGARLVGQTPTWNGKY